MASPFAGRRILITGGLGFIGSNLAIRLVEEGADVLLVDSMLPAYGATLKNIEPVASRLQVNFSDMRDRHSLSYLVRERDLIFSLAGQVSHSESMRDPETDLAINGTSQLSLLECCRHGNPKAKIIFASTRQIYGRPQYLPVDENHPLVPVDVNGINNLAAEMYYTLYHQVYGMPTVSLRLTNTYGPRMDLASRNKGFVGIFIDLALNGQRIQIFGDGSQRRDFNYVDDVVEALLLAAARDELNGQVFNLGHGTPYRLLEFVEVLHRLTGVSYDCVPFPEDVKAIDIGDYFGSYSRFSKATGWEPRIDLEEGLRRTLEHHRGRRK